MKRFLIIIGWVSLASVLAQAQERPNTLVVYDSLHDTISQVVVTTDETNLAGERPENPDEDDSLVAATVFNEEDWHQVNGKQYPYSAIVNLKRGSKDKLGCSGAMIGAYTVLTAAHCVYADLSDMSHFSSQYQPYDLEAYVGGESSSYKAKGNRIFVLTKIQNNAGEWTHMDYAIVVLDKPIGKKSGFLGVKNPVLHVNDSIAVLGFPGERDHSSAWLSNGKILSVAENEVHFDANVLPGNSGGPLFLKNDLTTVIGVVSFENRQFNGATKNEALLAFIEEFRDKTPSKRRY